MRRAFSLLYIVGLAALVVATAPRLVGDGREFEAMATQLAAGHMPRPGQTSHFWMYSALAVPGVWVAKLTGVSVLYAFGALNVALVGLAAWLAAQRLHWTSALLIFVSPILWWIDKAHTEPFTFALVAMTCVLSIDRPWWALVTAGLAATQNPPLALLVPIVAMVAVATNRAVIRDRRFVIALAAALALSVVHPIHYFIRLGRPTTLTGNIAWHVPNVRELATVLIDPNLGLAPAFPAFAIVVLVALAVLFVRHRPGLRSPDVMVAASAFVIFLWSVTQAANVNHGGTPGMSRYATWFIALAIPLLRVLEVSSPSVVKWLAPLAIASACWSAVIYRPSIPEDGMKATRLAMWLWTKHPAIDTPLPEVFTERLSGAEENWLPISTPGCEKVLIVGRGEDIGRWPVWCPPAVPPEACAATNQICYANRRIDGGYDFVEWHRRAPEVFRVRRELVWSPAAFPNVVALVDQLGAKDLSPRSIGAPGAFVASTSDVARVFLLQSARAAIVYLDGMGASARVTCAPALRLSGQLIDPADSRALRAVQTGDDARSGEIDLSSLSGPLVLVLNSR